MPASTTDVIYRLEPMLAEALETAFNADATFTGIAYGTIADAAALPKSRVQIAALGFGKASEQQVYAQDAWWDSHFAGDVTLTIVTQRSAEATATHAARLGRARYLMTPKAQILTTANFPHAEILSVENTGTSVALYDTGTDTDRTELTYRVELALLASAFPAA